MVLDLDCGERVDQTVWGNEKAFFFYKERKLKVEFLIEISRKDGEILLFMCKFMK